MARAAAKLTVVDGAERGRVFDLPAGERVRIGRGASALVRLATRGISRHHAELEPAGDRHAVVDAGSQNGTFVGEARVARRLLAPGDLVRFGPVTLRYELKAPDPLLGRTLAGYRIEERLGHGGMGTVYRAVQVAMDRTVALKILSDTLSEDRAFVSRFVEEARSAARLTHPHVVAIHNVGRHQGLFYISMAYLPGGSLEQLLRREGRLPPAQAAALACDACRALEWAERQGIVHRDIKPANLLLDAFGRAKVADFGIAADRERSHTLRRGGAVIGSPEHMAPEQALARPVDHRADIYALGSTLYAALAGAPPFQGSTPLETLARKVKGSPRPLRELVPDLPASLVEVTEKMMAPRPEDRFQHAAEALAALSRTLEEIHAAGPAPGASPLPPVTGPPSRYRGLLRTQGPGGRPAAALLCAALVGLAAGGWFLASRGREDAPSRPPEEPPVRDTAAAAPRARGPLPPEPRSPPPAPRPPSETKPWLERFRRLSAGEVETLLLESRFDEALERLGAFGKEWPEAAAEVAREIERVRAARTLFDARSRALDLAAQGDTAGARAVLEAAASGLPEELQREADLAIEELSRP